MFIKKNFILISKFLQFIENYKNTILHLINNNLVLQQPFIMKRGN